MTDHWEAIDLSVPVTPSERSRRSEGFNRLIEMVGRQQLLVQSILLSSFLQEMERRKETLLGKVTCSIKFAGDWDVHPSSRHKAVNLVECRGRALTTPGVQTSGGQQDG